MALHPYTGKPRNVVRLAELARREMRRFRDGRKPIWITELSWPAAKGKTKNTTGFETTDRGQARRLGEGLRLLARPASACGSSGSSGTRGSRARTRRTRSTTPACAACAATRIVSVPALAAFRKAARRLQGCAKAPGDATRCR